MSGWCLTSVTSNINALICERCRPETFGWHGSRPKPYGFTNGVCLRAYRETPAQALLNPIKYAIFPDGTRKRFNPVVANCELRGLYAYHGEQHCFGFVYKKRPHEITEANEGAEETEDNIKRVRRIVAPEAGLITFVLENGERFWRTTTDEWDSSSQKRSGETHEFIRFLGVEEQSVDSPLPMVVIKRVTESPRRGTTSVLETLPMNKFLEDFNPNESLFCTEAEERAIVVQRCTGLRVLIPKGAPYPFAVSVLMVLKCKFAWMRLHYKAQERKFAPGGAGHKRALQSDTAKTMCKKPREEAREDN
jgi:hypothetical protein